MPNRHRLRAAGLLLLLPAATCARQPTPAPEPAQAGLLITNAVVIDGTGSPGRRVSVRVRSDRIAEVGDLQQISGDQVVDAGGLVLAPGFIDTHTHADGALDAQTRSPSSRRASLP
jgi:N-acyl-D-amino-acid deacylase